ncbi:variant SH3 domain-containing protein [Ditylenchus destructor]|uniref:Variant SH3 domain-containing protein n=1 Tax=Ditylenchus destructor TaxID=166010 RepID=A0AAD4NEK2_9BILA|nr:variant SH3 domain-containing protein [Ditylenchus destructor]
MNFISPRRQNANCMSRITEEDFPMVSRENTLKGFPMREYNDVKQTMSRGFAPVFEREKSNEDRSRCQFDPKLLDVITSSIKGGGDYEADPKQIYHNSDRHHFSGKDCYMDSDRNTENMDLPYDPRIFMRSAASRYNVDERFPVSHHKETDPYKTEPRYKPNDDVRIYHPVYTNGGNYGLSPSPCHNNSMSNVSKLNPNYYLVERGRECDSLASRYLDEEGDEEENEACNEWVHESEIPLVGSNYMSLDKHYVKNFKEQNSKAETYKVTKKVPAVKYAAQPYDITVRKEIFGIDEILDDGQEIDLIFSQIVSDSRKVYPHRMRKYEIVSLNEILLSNSISAHLAQLTNEIPTAVKAQIIDAVRKWPLYFCRMYAVIEERPNDRVPLFIGISETGIRLISYNSANEQDPMIIQDHFDVLITSATQASEIKKCIEEYIYGCPSEKKRFVIAISDYSTNKPNILSFERGNFIEIVRNPDTESPVGNWTYGKLDNNFGWFPIDYVQPVADDQYDPEDNYTIRDDFYGQMMQSKLEPVGF